MWTKIDLKIYFLLVFKEIVKRYNKSITTIAKKKRQ
jgi:hypothetical protein